MPGFGHGLRGDPRDAEIRDLHPATGPYQNVGRLDVAVHDALAMRIVQGIGHLRQQRKGDFRSQETLSGEQAVQRVTGNKFHDKVLPISIFSELINGHNIRV